MSGKISKLCEYNAVFELNRRKLIETSRQRRLRRDFSIIRWCLVQSGSSKLGSGFGWVPGTRGNRWNVGRNGQTYGIRGNIGHIVSVYVSSTTSRLETVGIQAISEFSRGGRKVPGILCNKNMSNSHGVGGINSTKRRTLRKFNIGRITCSIHLK